MSPVPSGNGEKADMLIGKVEAGRPIADSGAGTLIHWGFASTLSLAYLIGALLCCFIGSLVTEKGDLIVKIKVLLQFSQHPVIKKLVCSMRQLTTKAFPVYRQGLC